MNKETKNFLIHLLKTMESLKDDPNREKFCFNFDESYKQLQQQVNDLTNKG